MKDLDEGLFKNADIESKTGIIICIVGIGILIIIYVVLQLELWKTTL